MTRVVGWEKALKISIAKHINSPSRYGVSDCYLICDDAVFAVTGERMFPDIIGQYTTPQGAAKLLLARGFRDVSDAFASKFTVIPPSMAQRGDIGVIENNGQICGGVFIDIGFAIRDDGGVLFLSTKQVKTAYKVGR